MGNPLSFLFCKGGKEFEEEGTLPGLWMKYVGDFFAIVKEGGSNTLEI